MKRLCFYKNTFHNLEDITLSPLDLGFSRGFAIFDYLRIYEKIPFQIEAHINRLLHAAKAFKIPCLYTLKKIKSLTEELIDLTEESNFGIRYVLTPGLSLDELLPGGNMQSTFLIYTSPLPRYPDKFYTEGICVKSIPALRIFPEYKTSNYLPGCFYLNIYKKKGFDDLIYRNSHGHYLEGITSNFFIIKNTTLVTPNEEIILGITRDKVLEIAQAHYDIELRPISLKDLKEATGAFYTSSTKEIMPVKQIDQFLIGNGKIPSELRNLTSHFQDYLQKNLSLYHSTSCL